MKIKCKNCGYLFKPLNQRAKVCPVCYTSNKQENQNKFSKTENNEAG